MVAAADPDPFFDLLTLCDQNIIKTQYSAKIGVV
jgi:hypothetical protein